MIWTFNRFMLGTDCVLASASVAIVVTKNLKYVYIYITQIACEENICCKSGYGSGSCTDMQDPM